MKRDVTSAMPVPLKEIHLLEKVFAGNLEVYKTNLTDIGHMVVALVRINSFHTYLRCWYLWKRYTWALQKFFAGNLSEVYGPECAWSRSYSHLTYCSETLQCISRQNYARFRAYFQMCKEFILAVRQKYDQFHVPNISPMDQLVQNMPDLSHIPSYILIRNIAMYF